ncbi:hypothetical protein QJS10_CPA07g01154 [Acorus calamus]|uniref:Fcf2 pre-rRNA processing C-terminal domain-containing protein n=1 Tax=Acorus calamus TaxID=4465 RepID=A0AAV9EJX4_ACOCL|nr:hypothetical protein QJS10_CPA07g01154 [Acorus calamus]
MSENKSKIGVSWSPNLAPLIAVKKPCLEKVQEPQSSVWKRDSELVDGLFVPPRDPKKLNKLLKNKVKDTSGGSWFDMPAPQVTPEAKKDLQILKLRSVIDPKRHYKKEGSKALPKYYQVGTIVEPVSEFFSGRLTKKERKSTLADELLSDGTFNAYRKRKVREIEEKHRPSGVEKWKIKGNQTRKRSKQRRHSS